MVVSTSGDEGIPRKKRANSQKEKDVVGQVVLVVGGSMVDSKQSRSLVDVFRISSIAFRNWFAALGIGVTHTGSQSVFVV